MKSQIIKLSASAVKTYDQCPRKYFYNYIEKAHRKHWDHFDLGNLCHKTLEFFHEYYMLNGTTKQTLSTTMSKSFSKGRDEFPKMSSKLITEAKSMISTYLKKMQEQGMPNVKGVETSFTMNIRDDVVVRGFLDRIDIMKDGRFDIIDYKTTKNTKYLDELQLLIYGLWLSTKYPNINEFHGSYVCLRHDSKIKGFDFNIEDVERVKKKLIGYADSIGNENMWSPIPTALCNWCDFQDLCPSQQSW